MSLSLIHISLGKIIRLWNIDGENPHVPDQSEIDNLLPEVGYEKIQVDGNLSLIHISYSYEAADDDAEEESLLKAGKNIS